MSTNKLARTSKSSVLVVLFCVFFSKFSFAVDGAFLSDAACPDSKYFSSIINKFCWGCTLPINLMGFSSSTPKGANDSVTCACDDDLGVPEYGFSLGYWEPSHILEVGQTPWCSPTLGGSMIQDDLTSMGTTGGGPNSSATTMATYHYNYFANPMFKMLGMFMVPECDKEPGILDMDLLYMSMLDVTWYQDLLAFIFNADAIAFANPIAQAVCMADCALITATGDPEKQNWFCAGCDGNMYPFTGNVYNDNNPVRNSHLIVTRALASRHRRSLSKTTYGKEAMCSNVYSPMLPKAMYKVSMAFPKPESHGSDTYTTPILDVNGAPLKDSDGNIIKQELTTKCCHPLGDFTQKWGAGRMSPGAGKDSHFVYNIFRYNDCCVRAL